MEDDTVFQYKCDNFYNKESEGAILYCDETINIPWNEIYWNVLDEEITPIVSEKDQKNKQRIIQILKKTIILRLCY